MSESTRRRRYRYGRVLIESARILTPQFANSVVYLTGPQIEMLRNVTQYLNRLDTYVEEHHSGYYLTPDAADYDDILEIVADLEETLMGNENVIFGYHNYFQDGADHVVSGTGLRTINSDTVPAGALWRLEAITALNLDSVCSAIQAVLTLPGGDVVVTEWVSPAAGQWHTFDGVVTMPPTSVLTLKFYGCQDGDYILFNTRGYTMDIP